MILRDVRSFDSPCIVVIPMTVFSSVVSSGYRRAPFWRCDTLLIVCTVTTALSRDAVVDERHATGFCSVANRKSNIANRMTVIDKCDQATKGVWWMSWHPEAMKDAAACDKLREAGKQALIRRFLNVETRLSNPQSSSAECIGVWKRTW